MEYSYLGKTGVNVSRIGLGGNTLGLDSSDKWEWSVGEKKSRRIIEKAIDVGITFFDTANSYSGGDSERVLGSVLSEHDIEEFVVASKVALPPSADSPPSSIGLSRKTIEQELKKSRDRLGIDKIDLYQMHRWDYNTPREVTVSAFKDLVRRGDIRYIGASSMWTHQFSDLVHVSERCKFEPISTMQAHYNLVYREEEREMFPFCAKKDIGVITWGTLAAGFLTRPHEDVMNTKRGSTSAALKNRPYSEGGGTEINERVEELAAEKNVSMAQLALAWVLHQEHVDVALVGATKADHIEDIVQATDITLSGDELEYLEEPYRPVPVSGHE